MAVDSSKSQGAKSSARAIEKLVEARFLLDEEDARSADAIAYVHAVLSQIGLPRSPTKERVWTRTNGLVGLRVAAGAVMLEDKQWLNQPLPQGPYARLILADISTYAVRHRTRVIPMEASVSAYMKKRLVIAVSGGAKGTYTAFKREAQALAAAEMSLSVVREGKRTTTKAPPVEEFDAWTVDDGPQQALWPCELVLHEKFYESLRAQAAPIDMRAYRALGSSCLAMDIYTWLAHRLPRLKAPLGLPWVVLAEQFGGYADPQRFRKEFIKRLQEVRCVYPDARLEVVRGHRGEHGGGSLLLQPSPPPVPRVGVVVPAFIGARVELGGVIPGAALPEDGWPDS